MAVLPRIPRVTTPARVELTFSDEFTGGALDTAKWNYNLPWGGWNNGANGEQQAYLQANVSVSGSKLVIAGKYEDSVQSDGTYHYTGGMINTRGKFSQTYGIFECRYKCPAVQGAWPAFWLLKYDSGAYPWPPELDVMEGSGLNPTQIQVNSHYNDSSEDHQQDYLKYTLSYSQAEWVTCTMDWTASYIKFYINGVLVHTVTESTAIPKIPMYLLVDLAIGGHWDFIGLPSGGTGFPFNMEVDYVRVWQRYEAS